MKPPREWFRLNAHDWLTDEHVRSMSLACQGAYIALLCYQWREGSLPADPGTLARLLGCDLSEMQDILSVLSNRFQVYEGRLYQRRLAIERREVTKFHKAQSERGRAGNAKRWKK